MAHANASPQFTGDIGYVASSDGTTIGYRWIGTGPGLVILHGATRASQHYLGLAQGLAHSYTVYIPDRRGRGLSGAYGEDYSVAKEIEDLRALLHKSGADLVFGHSAGGLIALEAALVLPIRKLAVYEPGVSINNSFPTAWLPAYQQALNQDASVRAMAISLKGLRLHWMSTLPHWVLMLFARLILSGSDGREMAALLPTLIRDAHEIQRFDSTYERYQQIAIATLLLGGTKSPDYFVKALRILAQTIPYAQLIQFPKLDHNAPDLNAPEMVAAELAQFFA